MIGELIATGITYGVGRIALNNAFSGTAEFNNIILDSGANFSGGTGGGVIYSGGTDLYNIFSTGGGGSTTAGNGLTKTGDNITLGGTLTGNTLIDIGHLNEFLIEGGSSGKFVLSGDSSVDGQFIISNKFSNEVSSLIVQYGGASLGGENSSGTVSSLIKANSGSAPGALMQIFNGLASSSMLIQESAMTISDNINLRGINYDANYHGNYVNRTLVDYEYVNNHVASAVTANSTHNFGTSGGTVNWDINNSSNAKITLSSNLTLNISNVSSGDFGTLKITQDGVGSHTITLGTGTHQVVNSGNGSITLTANANAVDVITFFYDGTEFLWSVGNDYT